MLHYRLRTLLIVLTLGPPVLAGVWFISQKYRESKRAVPDIEELQGLIETDWPIPAVDE